MTSPTSPSGGAKGPARYNFAPGQVVARKYEVVSRLRGVRGGELYALSERDTGIARTGQFFYPRDNPGNKVATEAAKTLHRLRHCGILLEYRTQEIVRIDGEPVTLLVSDLMRGETLRSLLARQPGGKLGWFEGLHLLRALTTGVEALHSAGQAHGAITTESLIVHRRGLGFDVKIVDFAPSRSASAAAVRADVDAMIRVFREAIGSSPRIRMPAGVRTALRGLLFGRVAEPIRTARELHRYLDGIRWA
jgi:tRNA A-37 threonylcarbamoyl transferase component Bud32